MSRRNTQRARTIRTCAAAGTGVLLLGATAVLADQVAVPIGNCFEKEDGWACDGTTAVSDPDCRAAWISQNDECDSVVQSDAGRLSSTGYEATCIWTAYELDDEGNCNPVDVTFDRQCEKPSGGWCPAEVEPR